MMRARTARMLALASTVAIGATACDVGTTTLPPETALLSVAPEGGSLNVALDAPVVVSFNGPMHDHAMDYAAVHEGDVTGPPVEGTWVMEEEGRVMRFTPRHGWNAGTEYTIHLGGGMADAEGHMVDFESHGSGMGGMWADGDMMSGGMHGGMNGGQSDHMGSGWDHPENGSHGMVFTFTTVP